MRKKLTVAWHAFLCQNVSTHPPKGTTALRCERRAPLDRARRRLLQHDRRARGRAFAKLRIYAANTIAQLVPLRQEL